MTGAVVRLIRSAPGGPAGADRPDAVRTGLSAAIDRAAELLLAARSVLILPHVNPDADALGSALGLGLALHGIGRTVQVAIPGDNGIPESLCGLPGTDLVLAPGVAPARADLVVTVDVNGRARLGDLGGCLDLAPHSLVIDHHASTVGFGTDLLLDPAAEATTVLVAQLLDRLGIALDADIAANLYAGLATDTVGFRFASPQGHRLAARLLECGIAPDTLMRPIVDTHPFGWLRLLSTVLDRARLLDLGPAGTLVVTAVELGDSAGLRPEELDSVIDILRTTRGANVAAVFKETAPQCWQVSLRSLPGTDVSVVACALGGGGHRRAAGYSAHGELEPAVQQLCRRLVAPGPRHR